jgi:hypothetical protein
MKIIGWIIICLLAVNTTFHVMEWYSGATDRELARARLGKEYNKAVSEVGMETMKEAGNDIEAAYRLGAKKSAEYQEMMRKILER